MGCANNTAARAFHDLQAKGFIIQTEGACLGMEGTGTAPAYELTEIVPAGGRGPGKNWFINWSSGHDFPIKKTPTRARPKTKPCRNNEDSTVVILETKRQ